MKKVIYIIPGFTENTKKQSYQFIGKCAKENNIELRFININWTRKVMTDYVGEFLEQYNKLKKPNEKSYILGFSYGAMISFISSQRINPEKIILCSLSPYFKEDLPKIKKSWKEYIGKNRVNNFKKHSFNEIAKKIKPNTILLIGEKEHRAVYERVKIANRLLKNSKLVIVKDSKHDIKDKNYQKAIKEVIGKL